MTAPRPTVPLAAFEAAEQAAYNCPCHVDGPGLSNCCLGAAVNAAAPHIEALALRRELGLLAGTLDDIAVSCREIPELQGGADVSGLQRAAQLVRSRLVRLDPGSMCCGGDTCAGMCGEVVTAGPAMLAAANGLKRPCPLCGGRGMNYARCAQCGKQADPPRPCPQCGRTSHGFACLPLAEPECIHCDSPARPGSPSCGECPDSQDPPATGQRDTPAARLASLHAQPHTPTCKCPTNCHCQEQP